MPTLGQRLREEREKRGLSIAQLAAQTRISAQYFEAIERDDTSSLPGGFFYRSFVRQYAKLMDLPESAYRAEIEENLEMEAQTAATQPSALPPRRIDLPPMPTGRSDPKLETQRWLMRLGALVLVILLTSGVYALWQKWKQQHAEAVAQLAQQQPVQNSAALKKEAQPEKKDELAGQPASAETKPPETEPVGQAKASSPEPAAPPSQPSPAAAPPASPTGSVRVIVRASELTWVGVWQGQKQLFGDALQPGETRGFGADDRLRLRIGNAGGVEIEWNGRTIPSTGPRGQVRTVDFWADGYTVVQPTAPAAAAEPKPPEQQ